MQRDVNKKSSHPSSKELADFVDGKLNKDRRAEITKHLIECDECSDVVALVMKYGKSVEKKTPMNNDSKNEHKVDKNINKPQGLGYANNWLYSGRVRAIVLSGLVASIVLFMVMPSNDNKLGMIDLSIPPAKQYKSGQKIILRNEVIDADKILNTIINSTDLSKIKTFQYAQEREKRGKTEEAKALYKQAFIEILNETDIKKRLKQKIVIHSKLFRLSKDEYRDILRYEIRLYIVNFNTRSK